VYRPLRSAYHRGKPIVSLADLFESADTHYTEVGTVWSFWPHDDNAWDTITSDTFTDLHGPFRLPVPPWVSTLHVTISAQNAEIRVETTGTSDLWSVGAQETLTIVLGVTPGDAGSERTNFRVQWRRRGGAGTGTIYGGSIELLPVSSLPTGV
jgi:hypothetical protein